MINKTKRAITNSVNTNTAEMANILSATEKKNYLIFLNFKIHVSWDVAPHPWVNSYRCSGGILCLHLQNQAVQKE
jgi:hypothetical protein